MRITGAINNNRQFLFYCALLISVITYLLAGYQLQREQFYLLILLFSIQFTAYFYLIGASLNEIEIRKAIWSSILFRVVLLLMVPNLSDDCYRFIWDGRLSAHGINPFSFLPASIVNTRIALNAHLDTNLYALLNSKNYYTVYPPVLQGVFFIAAKICPDSIMGSIVCMRVFILGAETGSILLLSGLLKRMNMPVKNVLIYALNPLVVFELTGNLHFEAFVIFFLLLFLYFLLREQWLAAIPAFSLAVVSKLIPLIFLPFLIRRLGIRKFTVFITVCFVITIISFVPFFNPDIATNIGSSIGLYFQTFEFNGSLFYLMRWLGYAAWGYDPIATIGKITPLLVLSCICALVFFKRGNKPADLIPAMLFSLSAYLSVASIVHPWYIAPLLVLSVFTRYRYALIWSGLVFLSYSAYGFVPYKENYLLLALEYVPVYGYAFYEIISKHRSAAEL